MTRPRAVVLELTLVCSFCGVASGATIGSYTFNFNGVAPAGTTIRITAKGKTAPMSIDEGTISIAGLDQNQTAKLVNGLLDADGAFTEMNGTNSIMITTLSQGGTDYTVSEVDGGSNAAGFAPKFDGNVPRTETVLPGAKWAAAFLPGNFGPDGITQPGLLTLAIAGDPVLTTALAAGETASDAAIAFYGMLIGAGFPDAQLNGTEVDFLLDPSRQPIGDISELSFSGANLEVGLDFPDTTPEPSSAVSLSIGLILLAGLLASRANRMRRHRPLG